MGDVHTVIIYELWKIVTTDPPLVTISTRSRAFQRDGSKIDSYLLEFPPNDEVFLPDFDRLFTTDLARPMNIQAELELTEKRGSGTSFAAKLKRLWLNTTFHPT